MEYIYISSLDSCIFSSSFVGKILKKIKLTDGKDVWKINISPIIPKEKTKFEYDIEIIYVTSRYDGFSLDEPSCFIYIIYPNNKILLNDENHVFKIDDFFILARAETYLTIADAGSKILNLKNTQKYQHQKKHIKKIQKNPIENIFIRFFNKYFC